MAPDPVIMLIIGAVVFVGAIVNGAVGFGFALVAVAALTFVIEARSAVIVMSVVAPVLSSLQVIHHRAHRRVMTRLKVVVVSAVVGCVVGTQLLVGLPNWALSMALGLFALYYVLNSLRHRRAPMAPNVERALAPAIGLTAGVMNGTMGASGPVLGSYLHAIGLRTRDFAFAISAIFSLMGYVRWGMLTALGGYTGSSFLIGIGLVVPSMIGQRIGFRLQREMDVRVFERLLMVVLALAAANLILKGLQGALAG